MRLRSGPVGGASWSVIAAALALVLACRSGRFVEEEKNEQAQAKAAESAVPPPPPPTGPVGTVSGVIRVSGDAPPTLSEVTAQIPPGECRRAEAMYGKLFREGEGRTLGDVLVAVTEYEGDVPSYTAPVTLHGAGCAFESRTAALAVWQKLFVKNAGPDALMPQLVGSRAPAVLVALPGGHEVPVPFPGAGEYVLLDRTHPFNQVDVFVLNFPTFTVTGLDGSYAIERVPAGAAKLTAFLPATGQKVERDIVVNAEQVLNVDLTIEFDIKKHGPRPKPDVDEELKKSPLATGGTGSR